MHSRMHTYQYIMWLNVFLDGGKRDGKFYKTYPYTSLNCFASMTLYNYYIKKKKSQNDHVYLEFDLYLNFVSNNFNQCYDMFTKCKS
jgi:hypothetical protein